MDKNHRVYADEHHEEEAQRAAKKHAETMEWLDSLKDAPCTDCGKKYPAICMDWDHVKPGKVKNIAAFKGSTSRATILAEIEKCELVCANCHRIRTANRGNKQNRKYDRSTWDM
jgi:hypothetical protein